MEIRKITVKDLTECFEDEVKVYDETFYFQWSFTTELNGII